MVSEFIHQYLGDFKPYKSNGCWCYENGIILSGAYNLYLATNDEYYLNFVLNYLDTVVDENGVPAYYDLEDYNIDEIDSGKVLFMAYAKTGKIKYKKAADLLYQQLLTHPRTKCGNFFHKKRYPFQVWMDGLYMGQPFYVEYSKINDLTENYDDTLKQFLNVRKFLFDENRHLYVHAYDENKVMQWADPVTGQAPNAWSRAIGWYAMAIVDILDILDDEKNTKLYQQIIPLLKELLDGMLLYLDPVKKMWYQVIDKANVKGNYLETSGTAMVAYAMMKGSRLGVIDEKYGLIGETIYHAIIKEYLHKTNGRIYLGGTCKVAGLDNERRNGSVEYYLSEEIVENEAKGVAPFLMLAAEVILKEGKVE